MSTQTIRLNTSTTAATGAVSRIRLVNQSVTGPAGADGAGVSVATKESGTEKVAVTTVLDFLTGFDVAGAAGVASVSLDLTEYAGGALPVAGGGTGATDASTARTNLGLGNAATLTVDADLATFVLPASTTISAFGATLVDDADASTARTTLGLGTAATTAASAYATSTQGTTADTAVQPARTISTTAPLTGGGDLSANRTLAVSAASDTAAGVVELATSAETITGTDATRAVTPAGGAAAYQPLDSDLTSIAALSTTSYGRAFLALANQAATMALLSASSDTAQGIVELATTAEVVTGSDTARAVTPAGFAAGLAKQPELFIIAVGDETTAITTGTAKVTFRMPFAFTLTAVRSSLTTASSSGIPTVDINEGGTTILSTKLTIDANELTSTTAATAAVISDSALADDASMTIDIDVAGTGAAGLKVYLIGTRA